MPPAEAASITGRGDLNVAEARGASVSDLEARAHAGPVRLRSIVGGLTGNMIEWYDFLAYSSFAIYLAKAFFPSDMPTVQLMNTAAIAAVGYIARPLGSWLIGLYADRQGPQNGAHAVGAGYVHRFVDNRRHARLRDDRRVCALGPDRRPLAARLEHGRRIRHKRDLSE
jgi:hypothetical protein